MGHLLTKIDQFSLVVARSIKKMTGKKP